MIRLMRVESLQTVFRALNEARCEYLVVGGIAVMAHGHVRLTQDVDIVLSLSSPLLVDALNALKRLGYRSKLPVDVLDFADSAKRKVWREEKNMVVFNLYSDQIPDVTIDIFPAEPFDFATEYKRAKAYLMGPSLEIPVISLARLIAMKREAARPQDLIDIDKLGKVQRLTDENS
jgi:predicted nucleotidyltransferase